MRNFLLELFDDCLSRTYRESENGASWDVSRRGEVLFLFFQHSHGLVDWLNNLDFISAPYKEMSPEWRCHGGFLRVWKSVKPLVEPFILDPSISKIVTVGYSHGAALAVLCHEFAYYHRPELRQSIEGYGFGCPRVLYGCLPPDIAERWDRFYVIRNLDDLVTHLPPRALGFCHVGNLVTVGKAERYSSIDAHRPENYRWELSFLSENKSSLAKE